jgi:hypothetical protein
VNHVVEAADNNGVYNEEHTLSFRVTPHRAGTLWVRVRTTMKDTDDCEYYNDHSASGGVNDTDQQGWEVERFAVNDTIAPLYLPTHLPGAM